MPSGGRQTQTNAVELLRLLCSTAATREAASSRLHGLAESVDVDALVDTAVRQRLAGVARQRLLATEQEHVLASGFSAAAAPFLKWQRDFCEALVVTEMAVEAWLAEGGVRWMPLKGPSLGTQLYGEPSVRSSLDLDFLVAPDDLDTAVRIVQEQMGYPPPADPVSKAGLPLLHYRLEAEGRVPLEFHWRVHWYEAAFSAELLESWSADGRLSPEAELACLLLFYARDGFSGLKLAADVAAWWDRRGSELEPGAMRELLERHPKVAPAVRTAAVVAGDVVGLPSIGLDGPRTPPLARRFCDWQLTRDPRQMSADTSLVDVLLAPSGMRARLLARHLFPTAPVVARWGSESSSTLLRVQHPFRQTGRWILGLGRAVRASRAHLPQ